MSYEKMQHRLWAEQTAEKVRDAVGHARGLGVSAEMTDVARKEWDSRLRVRVSWVVRCSLCERGHLLVYEDSSKHAYAHALAATIAVHIGNACCANRDEWSYDLGFWRDCVRRPYPGEQPCLSNLAQKGFKP